MGYLANILEDWESFLIETINQEKLSHMRKQEERLSLLKTSLEHRQSDILVLFQEGFSYNKDKDEYRKDENINYGKYPGKYRITIQFPVNYPKSHPIIRFRPLHSGMISQHISRRGNICLAQEEHGQPYTFWRSNMNVIGALKQAYHLVTDEIHNTNNTRRKIPIEGTIFSTLKRRVNKEEFIKDFAKPHKMDVDWTYDWEEIAYKLSQSGVKTKSDLVKYYNKTKKKRKT